MVDILKVPPSRFQTLGSIHNMPSRQIYFLKKTNFSPSSISNSIALHDPQFNTPNGGTVSALLDQSGNGNDLLQTSATLQPSFNAADSDFNDQPTVSFDGIDDAMQTAVYTGGDISQPSTICIVVKTDATNNDTLVDGIISFTKRHSITKANSAWRILSSTNLNGGTTDSVVHIMMAIFNNPVSKLYIDGGAPVLGPGITGSDPMNGLTWGAIWNGLSGNSNSTFGEGAVYNKELSLSELDNLGNHWATKFGLTWTAAT